MGVALSFCVALAVAFSFWVLDSFAFARGQSDMEAISEPSISSDALSKTLFLSSSGFIVVLA